MPPYVPPSARTGTSGAEDPLTALRIRERYDAAEPALHSAALRAEDPLAFLEAALEVLARTAGASTARAVLADDDDLPLVTVAVWSATGDDLPDLSDLSIGDVTRGARVMDGNAIVPFENDGRAGAFVLAALAGWIPAEVDALDRFGRLFDSLWARAGAEERLRQTLGDLEDGLFGFSYGTDGIRRYSMATPQMERIAGIAADDIVARPEGPPPALDWSSLVHGEDIDRFDEHQQALREGEASRIVYRLRRPIDGEIRWVRESATPGRSLSGRQVVGGLLSDVTEARRAEASLLQAKHAAERSSHARTAFLAVISHEIRSPLGAVRGFAELLEEEVGELERAGAELPPQIGEFAGVIGENTRRALHLVHRLFDLSRLETGSLALRSVPVELHPAVGRVLERHAEAAEGRGLSVTFHPAEAEPMLVADPERVEEVIDHLVSNAVKFTEEGSITITTQVEGDVVRLVVEDTGVGIDPDLVPSLFEPFQDDYRLNRSHSGIGLGLAVARRLLDGMGGTLRVESKQGVGSRFEVEFGLS